MPTEPTSQCVKTRVFFMVNLRGAGMHESQEKVRRKSGKTGITIFVQKRTTTQVKQPAIFVCHLAPAVR